jgi:hypothetical protein
LSGGSSIEIAYFVLFDEAARGVFEQTWQRLQAELS